MDYERFITYVQRAAGIGRDAPGNATRATLQTLAERISAAEARQLIDELPPRAGADGFTDGPAERFDVDEFLGRVAKREQVDLATAERHAAVSSPRWRKQ